MYSRYTHVSSRIQILTQSANLSYLYCIMSWNYEPPTCSSRLCPRVWEREYTHVLTWTFEMEEGIVGGQSAWGYWDASRYHCSKIRRILFHINQVLVLLICLDSFLGENRAPTCGLIENRVAHSLLPITFDIRLSGVLFLSHCALSRTHIRVETKKKLWKLAHLSLAWLWMSNYL